MASPIHPSSFLAFSTPVFWFPWVTHAVSDVLCLQVSLNIFKMVVGKCPTRPPPPVIGLSREMGGGMFGTVLVKGLTWQPALKHAGSLSRSQEGRQGSGCPYGGLEPAENRNATWCGGMGSLPTLERLVIGPSLLPRGSPQDISGPHLFPSL